MIEERRRYFRINDSMGVFYRRLDQKEAKAFAKQSREHGGNFDYKANFDNRIQTLLDTCKIQTPIAAELLDLLNKKLNFVISQMDIDSALIQKIAYAIKEVNASACGMAFVNEEHMEKGQALHLDISLQPSELHIVAMAEVVDCSPIKNDDTGQVTGFFLRLNFTEINANDQELLIQHIVKRQNAQLTDQRRQQQDH